MSVYSSQTVSSFKYDSSSGDDFDYSVCMEFLDIKRKLGQGGFGSVYLAYDKLNQKEVAVKILNF
jgi:serine/threonine protein kinase